MNELKIFEHEQFGQIRTVIIDGKLWFVANDVCDYFKDQNRNRTMRALDEDEKGYTRLTTPGGVQSFAIVSKPGLYQMLFVLQPKNARGVSAEYIAERKKQIKQFKRWLAHEVLPAIGETGVYVPSEIEILRDAIVNPKMVARLALALDTQLEKTRELSAKIEMDQPKVAFAEAVESSPTSIFIGDLAKLIQQNGIDMGQNRLFEWMRANHYLIRRGERRNMPTQRSLERGLFEISEKTLPMKSGTPRIIKTTKVTGKGQVFFINLFLRETA
jgi:anti-repressor protein